MNSNVLDWIEKTRNILPYNLGKVLELGSRDVNGSPRPYYSNCEEYIGIDLIDGKGVDIVMDAHDIWKKFGNDSFDVVIDMSLLEHDKNFWVTIENINKVLKKGGYHIFVVPTFNFPIHNYPSDYWRVSKAAVEYIIFEGYEILSFEEIFTKKQEGKKINPCICVIGRKL
jgi:predicted SAM-dependent methyltransferase